MNVTPLVAQICEDLAKKIPERTVWCASNTLQVMKKIIPDPPRWGHPEILADCEFAIVEDYLCVNISRVFYPHLCSTFLLGDPKCFDKVMDKILSYAKDD
jgi:hypothetical protein